MKTICFMVMGIVLLSFTHVKKENEIDGIWMGAYGANTQMETMIVKFTGANKIEWYKCEVTDANKLSGTYTIYGDSVVLTYQTANGRACTLHGFVNRRKNYVDGNWETSDRGKGSFYLKKQRVTEYSAQP